MVDRPLLKRCRARRYSKKNSIKKGYIKVVYYSTRLSDNDSNYNKKKFFISLIAS